MAPSSINGKLIYENENLDDFELQKRELCRLLGSAQSEEKRVALRKSLETLENSRERQFEAGDSPSASTRPIPTRRFSAGASPLKSLDDDLSSDGEGDDPLVSFSSPMRFGGTTGNSKFTSNSSSNGNSSSNNHSFSVASEEKEAIVNSVPRIDLGFSLNRGSSMPSDEKKSSVLAGFSPDLADTPLSGRGAFVPNSARPASARWRGSLELRTIPEFSAFNRPLSGAKKIPEIVSNAPPNRSSNVDPEQHNISTKDAMGNNRKIVLNVENEELVSSTPSSTVTPSQVVKKQETPMHVSNGVKGSASSANPVNNSAFIPYSSPPRFSTQSSGGISLTQQNTSSFTSISSSSTSSSSSSSSQQNLARCSPILELSKHIDIEDIWGSCVDPLRPPSALVEYHGSNKSSIIEEDISRDDLDTSPNRVVFTDKKHLPRSSSPTFNTSRQTSSISSSGGVGTSHIQQPNKQRTSLTSRGGGVWVTTGGFPQRLAIRLRRLAAVHRVQIACSGNPQIKVSFHQLSQNNDSFNTKENFESSQIRVTDNVGRGSTNKLSWVIMDEVDFPTIEGISSSVANSFNSSKKSEVFDTDGISSPESIHNLKALLYVHDISADPLHNIVGLDLEFENACDHFCLVSNLRIWGQVDNGDS